MSQNKTALVTGAEGFIGSNMVKFLQAKGWSVVGTYRPHDSNSFAKLPNLKFVQCDLRNGQRVEQVVQESQPTHIFHFGAQSLPTVSWADPVFTFESNIMGSLYLFEAVRYMKKRPVVVSACSSADYKVPAVNIRLFNTTGPGKTNDAPSDFVRRIIRIKKGLQPPVLEVGNLKPRRAFLDVQDTVRGFYAAAMKGKRGEVYNLCAPKTYEIGELLKTALRLSGVKAEIQPAVHLMRPSDEKIIFGSTDKLRKDTGWKPLRSVEQTLTSMLEYWD